MAGRWTRLRRFTRFSLRTFVLLLLLLGAAGALWRQWEPWVEVAVLEFEAQPISSVSFSPDGSKILTFSYGGSLFTSSPVKAPNMMRTWSSNDFRPLAQMEWGEHPGDSGTAGGRFSPDGKWLVSEMVGHVHLCRLFDAETGADILETNAQKIEFLRASSLALVHTEAGSCFIYDLEQGVRWAEIGHPKSMITTAHATPNAEFIVTLGDSIRLLNGVIAPRVASLCIWNARSGKLVRTLTDELNQSVYSHYLSYDGKLVIGVMEEQKKTAVWKLDTGEKIAEFEGVPIDSNPLIPNSYLILMRLEDWKFRVLDLANGKVIAQLARHPLFPKPFTSDGRKLVFYDRDWGGLTILNHPEFVQTPPIKPIGSYDYSIISQDNKFVTLICYRSLSRTEVHIYNLEHGMYVMDCRADTAIITKLGYAVTCAAQGKYPIQIWNLNTHSIAFELPLGTYKAISASPDGQRIAFISPDGTARVWERRRDEGTVGLFALPSLWLTALFFAAFFWSAIRDVKELKSA